jgi:hypothetical protein
MSFLDLDHSVDAPERLDPSQIPFVRSANNYDTMLVSNQTGLFCADPSLTQQQFKDDSDINLIVDTFARTKTLPDSSWVDGPGVDLTGFTGDFHAMQNQLFAAANSFMQLPAALRSRFDNDPAKLMSFLHDDANRAEAVKLGLVSAPKEDLSTGDASQRAQHAGEEASPVGKSGKQSFAAAKGVSSPLKGYRLVPDDDEGGV